MHNRLFFDATIEIKGIDRKGMLMDVSKVISAQLSLNIHRITINSDEGIFDGTIELRVHDQNEVQVVIDALKEIKGLQEVQYIM
jgi:GTP pyrophosphokinase